ncbi:NADPH-dependent 2,4-dienoyl-CoA reductase/sulfur reductase-like enzyme [Herbaspirillum sp. Sphag1AN]|uniref:FAD/NAD(P)-dependent oxidoreductase n=1 Tax=unclassified Herbaspirillum TaxID=2624150 RepID=UPI00161ADC10|nr:MULTISPECIES: NAD(P)/FAD-dependent oxidoreductase [unclassified Herbaspirillum]MBB3214071.1 NADPH-dependent 2,4-dienoyl-CoA reductase/sulfur reductase-like enzyme [Herbaspirillum sp. Sphag1AN]MBB3247536.1 NADPH-dependent 2,4-dienoyl-CoA reductase/sulfur reductase-like enzyme [Herbaspirillum sp. Sphag64]
MSDTALPQVVIVGAGPAGIRAAEALVAAGIRPLMIDEGSRAGGQIYRQPPDERQRSKKSLYGFEAGKAAALHARFAQLLPSIDYRPDTLVWNCTPGQLDLLHAQRHVEQPYTHLILCTGALDRVMPFPGWILPGVYTLGAAQVALKAQACVLNGRMVIAGSGPLLYLLAYQYVKAGANVVAVLDTARLHDKLRGFPSLLRQPVTLAKGLYFIAWLRSKGIRLLDSVQAIAASGDQQISRLRWQRHGKTTDIDCDALATGFGLRSETQLADLAGCEFAFDTLNQQWLPTSDADGRSSVEGIYLAGDGHGIAGADAAELSGRAAALALLQDLQPSRFGTGDALATQAQLRQARASNIRFRQGLETTFPTPVHWARHCPDETIICRCEEITAGQLRHSVAQDGTREINRLKALTRVGMGRCQGRVCGAAAAEILSHASQQEVAAVGRLRGQAPIKPIPVSVALAALAQGNPNHAKDGQE